MVVQGILKKKSGRRVQAGPSDTSVPAIEQFWYFLFADI